MCVYVCILGLLIFLVYINLNNVKDVLDIAKLYPNVYKVSACKNVNTF